MRCLLIVHRLPWPPTSGGRLRDWQNVRALSALTDLSVVALHGVESAPPLTSRVRTWTSLDSELLRDPIPFDRAELVLHDRWWLNELGHPGDSVWRPFRASALRRLLARHRFDIAVIEDVTFWRYADIVREHCPTIIDYHNVQSQLDAEYLAHVDPGNTDELCRRRIALHTMYAIEQKYRDLPSVVCSEDEKALLVGRGFSAKRVRIVHNTVAAESTEPMIIDAGARILFAGAMNYRPNALAAMLLVTKIFPLVRSAVPAAELWVVGMSPRPNLLLAARDAPGVFITGEVAHTRDYFRHAAALSVPLTMGGGTRFKILEAFLYGVPVVSSPKGCEGLAIVEGRHLLLASSPEEHAERLIELLRDRVLAARLTTEASALLRSHYSFDNAQQQWDDCLRAFGFAGG
jgi:glycosyltransferase involved in cell wall biosynthesis